MPEPVDYNFNKRVHARVNLDLDMYLVLVDANATGLVDGQDRIKLRRGAIKDISVSGLKITTQDITPNLESHLLSGAITLAIRFNLPNQVDHISALAKVTWLRQVLNLSGRYFLIGLRFLEIKPQDQNMISTFIAEQKR